jgi:hypothetical protein
MTVITKSALHFNDLNLLIQLIIIQNGHFTDE